MFWKPPKKSTGNWAPGSAGARVHKRTRCSELFCNLGRVIDLSPAGAGLLTQAGHLLPGVSETIRLDTEQGTLDIAATVAWVRSDAERPHRVGIEFTGRDHRAALKTLCRRLRDEELDRRESVRD